MRIGHIISSLSVTAALFVSASLSAQERVWANDPTIVQISEHVYRWGSDNQFGAYILTDDGIVVVDGHYCGSPTMAWLKGQLDERYDVPVKYVVLSHDHPDHVCGSQVFNDTASAVSHRRLLPHILFEQRPSAVPEITFDDEMDLHLGGVHVKLLYFGPTHSDNLIQVHIPEDRVLIAIDSAKGRSLFPDFRDMEVNNQIEVMQILANLPNVDVVLPGHGPVVDQNAFIEHHDYLVAMKTSVLQHMAAGRTLDEIKVLVAASQTESFGDYRGMENNLVPNIVTMWDYLYRYREPNVSIKQDEALRCIEDATQCRTGPLDL
jgi:glyoxylase-like metal-dependent hydrolase (beta-lactamase superfamily II)